MKTYREFILEVTSPRPSLMSLINRGNESQNYSPLWGSGSPSIPTRPNINLPNKPSVNLTAATAPKQSPNLRLTPSQITKPTSNFATPAKPKEDALSTWAKSNKSMIQKSGTQAQRDILSKVEAGQKPPMMARLGQGPNDSIFNKEGGRDQYLANMRRSIRGGSQYNSNARTMDVTNISADKG